MSNNKMPNLYWPFHTWEKNSSWIMTEYRTFCPEYDGFSTSMACFNSFKDLNNNFLFTNFRTYDIENNFFWKAFGSARFVCFVDKYFLKTELHNAIVEAAFYHKTNTRDFDFFKLQIFSKVDKYNKQIIENYLRTKLKEICGDAVLVEVLPFSDTSMIHDRFALFDDNIWHCGASIGGFHKGLHAISGPWPDTDQHLRRFLDKTRENILC